MPLSIPEEKRRNLRDFLMSIIETGHPSRESRSVIDEMVHSKVRILFPLATDGELVRLGITLCYPNPDACLVSIRVFGVVQGYAVDELVEAVKEVEANTS